MIIPGFSKYDITEDGVVTHVESGRVMRVYKTQSSKYYPYIRVSLIGDDGSRHACNIIRLLALAFLDKPDEPCTAKAKDGNNLNTKLSNVEWVPYATSTKNAWKSGKYANRTPKKNACCNEDSIEMVLCALEQFDEPVSVAELGRVLDVPYSTVRYTLKALVQHGKVQSIHGKGHILVR